MLAVKVRPFQKKNIAVFPILFFLTLSNKLQASQGISLTSFKKVMIILLYLFPKYYSESFRLIHLGYTVKTD